MYGAFNRRKNGGKEACIRLHGFTALFAAWYKHVDRTVIIMRTEQMKDAYVKRFKLDIRGN